VPHRRLAAAAVFAFAMACVEAAVVVYLRRLHGITDLIRDRPLFDPFVAAVEVTREAATLVMLLAFGWVAGRNAQSRLGFAFFAFGVWDIFYYVWLRAFLDWPASLLEPDVLFLIPLPWWGPVLCPALVALLMAAGGAAAVIHDDRGRRFSPRPSEWAAIAAGAVAVLYSFMADALAALPAGYEELNRLRPDGFAWPIYLAGLAAMAWGVARPALLAPARDAAGRAAAGAS
jgi:hypothetical protein